MNAPQGSEAWAFARCGRATASCFADVLAKGQGKSRATYLRRVLAERLTGKPVETYRNGHMDRGQEQEPWAREAYEVKTGELIYVPEFIPHDTLMAGCSPDGLIGDDGGGEFKCVIPTVQVETILRDSMPPEHKAQVQGNLWITGREWWDFCSFCPDMPEHLQLVVYRVLPDRDYIANLEREVAAFLHEVQQVYDRLMDKSTLLDKLVASIPANHPASQP
jgi:hypothetical protein